MYTQEEINELIRAKTGVDDVQPSDDLRYDLGVWGDDLHELLAEYANTFSVDMSGYLWYFHTEEEGQNFGGGFFKPPNERVKHIPITPALLLDMANKGRWDMIYPEHRLPKRRWDIIINQALALIFLVWIVRSCLK